jgi:hypothetical protein
LPTFCKERSMSFKEIILKVPVTSSTQTLDKLVDLLYGYNT